MNNEKHAKWSNTGEHPTDDELLCFVDGEQTPAESEAVQFHLKACWSCRVRAEKLNHVISSFVEFRGQYLKPIIKETHDDRGNFNLRLNQTVAEMQTETPSWTRWQARLVKFIAASHRILSRPIFNFLRDERRRRLLISSGAAVLLFSVLFTYLFWIPSMTPVSAEELLDKTSAARQTQLKNKELPVVYQQLLVKHRTAAGEKLLKAELWQDETYSRVRRTIGESGNSAESSSVDAGGATKDRLLTGLEEILRTNNFIPAHPFSVAGLRAWRNTLTGKKETVEADAATDGTGVLRLKTEVISEVENGKLLATTLTVRSGDYHPVEQHFVIKTADGAEEEYSVQEKSFAVISLNSLSPDFFGDKPPTVLVTKANSKPESDVTAPSASPSENPVVHPDADAPVTSQPPSKTEVASPELEVEVLELLHRAGADLGEQVEVVREPNGLLEINGVVETAERKKQLLNALRPVSGNRAIRINIQTVEEAVAAEQKKKQKNQGSAPVVQMETRKIEGVSFPAETQVREFYAKQGGDNEAVRQYALRSVNRSAQAMRFLYALKRLKNQMKADDFGKLSPAARAKLLNLVKTYVRSYQNEVIALRRDLQPIFGGGGGTGSGAAIGSDAELFSAIERLFELGAASDQAVNNALATGRGKSGGNALQSAEFWRNLASAEAIAERLQNVK